VRRWPDFLPATPLLATPCFDARAVCYPSVAVLRDYLAWRQADCHVNNQYNAAFWALVHGGLSPAAAQARLAGTGKEAKNEVLFQAGGVAYAHLPALHRKGSLLFWHCEAEVLLDKPLLADGSAVARPRRRVRVEHCDIIGDAFWTAHPELLAD
jgi:tRNA(His) guanylyltransferase